MTDQEVDRVLGYTPCVCGVIDGTWHPKCYAGKTQVQINTDYRKAYANARKYLRELARRKMASVILSARTT